MSVTSNHNVSNHVGFLLDRWSRSIATRLAAARWPMALGGFVVVAALTWWVTNSAVFDLRTLRIEGNAHLTKKQVARFGDLTTGVNVLWTLPGTIERRLERHPWIKEAHVSRTLPSALTVVITERRPVAVLPGSGAIVAPDGKILGKKEESPLPAISAPLESGAGEPELLSQNGIAVARTMPKKVRKLVEGISLADTGRIELRLRDGTRVVYGDRSDLRAKAAVLRAVLEWAEANAIDPKTIDVSVPTAPSLVPIAPVHSSA